MTISKKMHILFASAEAAPFVKTGGLGDVAGSLPAALNQAGAETIVMVPLYNTIPQKFKDQMEFITSFYVSLGWRNEYCGLLRLVHNGVTYMFIDNQRYSTKRRITSAPWRCSTPTSCTSSSRTTVPS